MPAADETALAFAGWLRGLDDAALSTLLAARSVRESAIRDWFDLAEALLHPESVRRGLARLDRATLQALRRSDPRGWEPARALGLAFDTVPSAVIAELPTLDEGARPAALVPVAQMDQRFTDRAAAERALRTTRGVVELLLSLRRESARALARGGLGLPDGKRLADAAGLALDEVAAVLGIAERAGLAVAERGRWLATAHAEAWLDAGWGQRWSGLAGAWLDRLPDDIQVLLGERAGAEWGAPLLEAVDWMFPLGGEWMHARVAIFTRDAEFLGITAAAVPSSAGTALLLEGPDEAARRITVEFPPIVDSVYLQHDLSVIATGMLRPELEARLRELADRDGDSVFRISAETVQRALGLGRTEVELRALLGQLSLSGIPQPLDYLLRETARRFGAIRVRARGTGSLVHSDDGLLLRTVLADSALRHLGLEPVDGDGTMLRSRFDRDLVFWALIDARHPAAAEDGRGRIVPIAPQRAGAKTAAPARSGLVERLRLSSADPGGDDRAWLVRQLDLAIRGKIALTVTVAMPNGSEVAYELEPASVAGGRLRARDRAADVERTLPLRSIVAVAAARA